MQKLVRGWGINDADYTVKVKTAYYENGKRKFKEVWSCPFYQKWLSVLERCSESYPDKKPSYAGVSAHENWKYFSNFKSWMENKDWHGLQLDKDILYIGNRVYGPDTCAFVPQYINILIAVGRGDRELPIGVSYHHSHKDGSKVYYSRINNEDSKNVNIGLYTSVAAAHKAWQWEKARVIEAVVQRYSRDKCFDTHVAEALISRAWKLRLDYSNNVETKLL